MNPSFIAERPLGYTKLTVDTATALTIPPGCSTILVIPETQAVRWRDDNVAPTATVGQPLAVGSELRYTSRSPTQLQFIGQAAGGSINVTFYGQGGN